VTIDLSRYIRPGDLVTWGQACAEPRTLTEALVEQAGRLGPVRCFAGIPAQSPVAGDLPASLRVISYCGTGSNAGLYRAGRLEVLPVHYSALPGLLTAGPLKADVVFVQVSPPDDEGRHSLGLADDYFSAALDTARIVIAEVNDQVPVTRGARFLRAADMTTAVSVSRPPAQLPYPTLDDQTRAAARVAASLVEDGATVQFGIGAMPSAVLEELHDHRDLGIHSGILTDAAVDLIEAGAASGSRKSLDRGIAVGGLLGGTARLFRYADRNPGIALRGTSYTHSPQVLGDSHLMTTINSAIEVDLTGQVNAEAIGDRYIGAVGGATDFVRGANLSKGGLPLIVIPSTARGASRIVPRLSGPVSTPRAEPIVVVTEHGTADLRGLSLEQRVAAMISVADPAYRRDLDHVADRVVATA
jgi:acyl-CoA hydrolase